MMQSFFQGIRYFFRGLLWLRHPSLKKLVIIPLMINALFFISLLIYLGVRLHDWLQSWFGWMPQWLADWLGWTLIPMIVISMQGIFIFFFTLMANFLASPFNSLLSERTEWVMTGSGPPELSGIFTVLRSIPLVMTNEIGKIIHSLLWSIPWLLLFLVPVVHLIALPIWFLYSSWMMSVQYIDLPMSSHQMAGARIRQLLRGQPMLTLGFGISVNLFAMIPILNILVIPAAVIGATLMWVEVWYKNERLSMPPQLPSHG